MLRVLFSTAGGDVAAVRALAVVSWLRALPQGEWCHVSHVQARHHRRLLALLTRHHGRLLALLRLPDTCEAGARLSW